MSYAYTKEKIFVDRPSGDAVIVVERKRSEGRLKRHESCPDIRAWCLDDEAKRKYLLEVMAQASSGSSFGRYVPVPSLLDAVQANCHAEMADLQRQLEAYRCLKLTPDQRTMLEQLLKRLNASGSACGPQSSEGNATTTLFEFGSEASKDNDDLFSSDAESDVDDGDLRKQLLRKESTIKSLRQKLAAIELDTAQSVPSMHSARSTWDSPADDSAGEISDLRHQLDNALDRIQQLEREQAELEGIKAELGHQNQLQRDYDDMKVANEEFKNCLANMFVGIDQLNKQVNNSDEKLKESEAKRMSLEADMLKYKEQLARGNAAMQERDELCQEVKDNEEEIRRLLAIVEKQSRVNTNMEDRMSQSLSSLHIEMENKDKRISQLEEQLSELPHLHAEIKRLQDLTGNTSASISQEQDHSRTEKDINSLEEELKQERQLTKALKDELNQLRAELNSLKLSGKLGENCEQDMMRYNSQIKELQEESNRLKEELAALVSTSGKSSELRDELEREKKARADSEDQLRSLAHELENQKDLTNELHDEYGKAKSTDSVNADLRGELLRERNARVNAEHQVKSLHDQLVAQTEEYNAMKVALRAAYPNLEEVTNEELGDDRESTTNSAGMDNDAKYRGLSNERNEPAFSKDSIKKLADEKKLLLAERDEMKSKRKESDKDLKDSKLLQTRSEQLKKDTPLESTDNVDDIFDLLVEIEELKDGIAAGKETVEDNLSSLNRDLLMEVEELKKNKEKFEKEGNAREAGSTSMSVDSEGGIHELDEVSCKEKLRELINKNKLLQAENESLRILLATEDADTGTSNSDNSKVDGVINDLEEQIKSLKSKIAEKEEKHMAGEQDIKVQTLVDCLESEKQRSEMLQEEAKELKDTMNRELLFLQDKCVDLEEELAKLKIVREGGLNNSASNLVNDGQWEEKIKSMKDDYEKQIADLVAGQEMAREGSEQKLKSTNNAYEKQIADLVAEQEMSRESSEQKLKSTNNAYEKQIADLLAERDLLSKNYNANLSAVKETYERDMKAQNERHNDSVKRLQSLHEDEVKDMNAEFEMQMKEKADLLSSSTSSVRQTNMQQNVERKHQIEMENLKSSYEDKLRNAGQSSNAGVDMCKDKIEMLKEKFEKLMVDEVRKHKMEVDKLRCQMEETHALGKGKTEIYELAPGSEDVCSAPCSVATRNRPASPSRGISPSISAILRKILEHGFDALTLEELTHVHEPICTATGRMIDANPEVRPVDASLLAVGTHQLCGRIYQLEKEIMHKEQALQKKVCSLESSVDYEKQRLQDLKMAFAERERNNRELNSKLSNHLQVQGDLVAERDMLRNQALHHENRASAAAQQLEREKSKIRRLEDELNKERNNNQHLVSQLESERIRSTNSNMKQSDLLESMRIHLEASRDKESRLRFELERLMSIQQHGADPSTNQSTCLAACNTALSHPDRHSAAEAEDDLVVRLQMELRREQRSVEQIQTLLDTEKLHATQRIEREREKSKKLRKQLSATEDEKENVIIQLDSAREALSSQQLVVENLERKMVDWQGAEQRRHMRWADEEDKNRKSLEKALCAKFELEQKIIDMEQEMMELRERASEPGDSVTVVQLQQQLAESFKREQQLIEQMSATPRENKISTSLLQKLQVMNSILETHVAEHTEIVNRLTVERQQLREKVKILEARDTQVPERRKFDENEAEIVSGILSAERATWSREKAALLSSLAQAEAIRRQHDNNNADADRVRHLFGKYLRVESYRKALVWQKRYLMIVINGYQDFENKTLDQLTHIAKSQTSIKLPDAVPSSSNRGTVNKFRSCGMAIIAVHRMKFLVRRWRHSRSIGSTAVFIHGSTESIASAQSSYYGSRRHVPSYWSVPRGIPSSLSPTREHHSSTGPTSLNKDSHMLKRWQQEPQYRSSEAITGLEPLQMTEYISRFDHIQQRLGLAVAQPQPPS